MNGHQRAEVFSKNQVFGVVWTTDSQECRSSTEYVGLRLRGWTHDADRVDEIIQRSLFKTKASVVVRQTES